MISSTDKKKIVKDISGADKNTGSTASQVAILSAKIKDLAGHFKEHKKDHQSRLGLLKMVGKRNSLLKYLKRQDSNEYSELVKKLGIRSKH